MENVIEDVKPGQVVAAIDPAWDVTLGSESAKRLARYIRLRAEADCILCEDPQLQAFLRSIAKENWSEANLQSCLIPSRLAI